MAARRWRRSTRPWKRARCARKVCGPRRRARCSTHRRAGSRGADGRSRSARAGVEPRRGACQREHCSPAVPAISSRGSQCTRRCRKAWRSRYWSGFGAVGQGMGAAIGTGAANPDRQHVAVEGDGSLMFNIQELETVRPPWDADGAGSMERWWLRRRGVHELVAKGFNEKLAQWESPNFVALAKAFGGDGVLLKDPSELGAAIAEGLRKGGLYLIDARVSPSTPTEPYAKVHFDAKATRRYCGPCTEPCASRASSAFPAGRRRDQALRGCGAHGTLHAGRHDRGPRRGRQLSGLLLVAFGPKKIRFRGRVAVETDFAHIRLAAWPRRRGHARRANRGAHRLRAAR